ncbi:MAG: hypothetical protein KAJ19_16880, partial [Gammaproteobacteria bacterium]|nr:hypothetical protein [Gammaproteobacteria bacterium]
MKCTKISGKCFSIWLLCNGDPFGANAHKDVTFVRYILQESDREPTEYIEKRSGQALLPIWGFVEELLPRARLQGDNTLFKEGVYLGHPLVQQEVLDPEPIVLPGDIKRLVLDSELVIGTGRNFRDDGKGRKSKKDNYNYVPFTKDNYDEMIDAGISYFTAKGEQIDWIYDRAVFYDGRSSDVNFPEELYRSNFLGHSMFIDEPACLLAGEYPEGVSTDVPPKMIYDHITKHKSRHSCRKWFQEAGLDMGDMKIVEPLPIWETYVGTSYYQLAANPYGFVQECRWHIDPDYDSAQILILQRLNAEYDAEISVTPENLFLWFYSQMRGPARVFGSRWGMSIYGQAEPQLRLPSMKLAYDMGASYIWFWTSDHGHHVPYTEQIALTRAIRQYADANPRPPLKQLISKAETVIVLPYGYTLPSLWHLYMWGTHLYATDRTNDLGKTYKEVLTPAIKHISYCLANNIPYDVVPAGPEFDPTVYKKVIRINEDATVVITDNRRKKPVDIMTRKKVVMVPMRDGTKLHTECFLPNDTDSF